MLGELDGCEIERSLSAYFFYRLFKAAEVMNKRPGDIERRFPLYDLTRYLTNMSI